MPTFLDTLKRIPIAFGPKSALPRGASYYDLFERPREQEKERAALSGIMQKLGSVYGVNLDDIHSLEGQKEALGMLRQMPVGPDFIGRMFPHPTRTVPGMAPEDVQMGGDITGGLGLEDTEQLEAPTREAVPLSPELQAMRQLLAQLTPKQIISSKPLMAMFNRQMSGGVSEGDITRQRMMANFADSPQAQQYLASLPAEVFESEAQSRQALQQAYTYSRQPGQDLEKARQEGHDTIQKLWMYLTPQERSAATTFVNSARSPEDIRGFMSRLTARAPQFPYRQPALPKMRTPYELTRAIDRSMYNYAMLSRYLETGEGAVLKQTGDPERDALLTEIMGYMQSGKQADPAAVRSAMLAQLITARMLANELRRQDPQTAQEYLAEIGKYLPAPGLPAPLPAPEEQTDVQEQPQARGGLPAPLLPAPGATPQTKPSPVDSKIAEINQQRQAQGKPPLTAQQETAIRQAISDITTRRETRLPEMGDAEEFADLSPEISPQERRRIGRENFWSQRQADRRKQWARQFDRIYPEGSILPEEERQRVKRQYMTLRFHGVSTENAMRQIRGSE